ncbi:hypothetical protein [Klugiella xanthotipulae]|uniref:Uncharacterized protein n=1 Tax=Klugiella xanthotipulae TaxID=244735 RepID=A0A543HH78_9MICO|nr:hypothetical protein [Klugiella xanthotipulae]TQM57682.1 hypothetical protein FB466_2678 [Klugiella xanthotipulae]
MTTSTPSGADDNLDAEGAAAEPVTVETVEERVVVRRAVRYPRLMVLGAIIGVVLGGIVTLLFPVGKDYTLGQILGFVCLAAGVIGLALGGLLALILDRTVGRRQTETVARRVTTHNAD